MSNVVDLEQYRIEKELEKLSEYPGDLFDYTMLLTVPDDLIVNDDNTITLTLGDPETYTHQMYTISFDDDITA